MYLMLGGWTGDLDRLSKLNCCVTMYLGRLLDDAIVVEKATGHVKATAFVNVLHYIETSPWLYT